MVSIHQRPNSNLLLTTATDYERVAIVGRKSWMDWMTQLMKPFTCADVRYFDLEDQPEAKRWIESK